MPFIRPREHRCADATGGERCLDLPHEAPGLFRISIASAVETDLGHQQRLFAGKILQAREIRFELIARFEIDVEAVKIKERQLQVFGGREVDIRHQRGRILALGDAIKSMEEALDAAPAVPSNHACWDLIADRVAEDRRMSRVGPHVGRESCRDRVVAAFVFEERDVLLPRQADDDAQTVRRGNVEQPALGRRVHAHRVEAMRGHVGEIALDSHA